MQSPPELTPERIRAIEDEVATLRQEVGVSRADMAVAVSRVYTSMSEIQKGLGEHTAADLTAHNELRDGLRAIDDKLTVKLKVRGVVRLVGSFVGGAAVALVPGKAGQIADILSKILEAMP